jgi:hypothetical protein
MANVKHNLLSAAKVKNLTTPGTHADGDGLTLRVSDTGAKSWVMRLTIDGSRRNSAWARIPLSGWEGPVSWLLNIAGPSWMEGIP